MRRERSGLPVSLGLLVSLGRSDLRVPLARPVRLDPREPPARPAELGLRVSLGLPGQPGRLKLSDADAGNRHVRFIASKAASSSPLVLALKT